MRRNDDLQLEQSSARKPRTVNTPSVRNLGAYFLWSYSGSTQLCGCLFEIIMSHGRRLRKAPSYYGIGTHHERFASSEESLPQLLGKLCGVCT